MVHVELFCNECDIEILALELEGGRSRNYLQVRQFGKYIEQFFGDAIGKIILLGVRGHVDKRQHGNGFGTGISESFACIFGLELEGYSSRKNEEGEELRGPAPLRREAQMPRMGFEAE